MSVAVTHLPSGLVVVTDSMPGLETASIGVHVGAGARSEAADEHGLAHLLEHMAFKGTARRDARRIAEEIEAVGGDLNAATAAEQTAYYARVLKADMPLALDILADILTGSLFDAAELEREKNVILQEIGAVEDTPDDLVYDLFTEAAFPGQPLGRRILGTRETVASFDRAAIEAFIARHYRAGRMVIAAAGAVDHRAIVDQVADRFAAVPPGLPPAPAEGRYAGGQAIRVEDFEEANLVLGFPGLGARHPDLHALALFTNLLGGGMSSRLFQEVREKRGLCYSIHAFQWSFEETGLFGIAAGASEGDLATLMPVIVDTLLAAADAPGEAQIGKAKAQLKASLLMALESSGARAEQLARHMLVHGRPLAPSEITARIDAVTAADIRRVAAALIAATPTLAAIGPVRPLLKGDAAPAGLRAA